MARAAKRVQEPVAAADPVCVRVPAVFFFTAFAGGLSRDLTRCPDSRSRAGYTAFQFVFVLLQSAAFAGVFTWLRLSRATSSAASPSG